MNKFIALGLVASGLFLTGCVDLKPLQAQVDGLSKQVGKVEADVSSLNSRVTAVEDRVTVATADAANAKSVANVAAADAAAAKAATAQVDEKIDRMFKRSMQK